MNRPCPSFLIFQDQKGYWRWNFADGEGRIVAASTIAFARPAGCVQTIRQLRAGQPLPLLIARPDGEIEPGAEQPAATPPPERKPGERMEDTLDLKADQILH